MVDSTMFDVFLAHNSVDKPQVRAIAEKLKRRKLKPWLDEEQIPPGRLFQEEIQKAIPQIQSAAICIGTKGLGKWQVIELQAIISQFIEKGSPVIPILLPGVERIPNNLLFLQQFNWVSFAKIDDANSLFQLEWGITGIKPQPQPINLQPIQQPAIAPNDIVSPPSKNQIYKFDVVTVNAQGAEIKRESAQAEYLTENLGNDITLDMVYIPGGKFLMGTEDEEIERLVKKFDWKGYRREKPQHEVTVTPFLMGKYPITQAQWKSIASRTDLKAERDLNPNPAYFKELENSDRHPVEQVSWYDAAEFCQRLSQHTGKEYLLPSEAQWEYACRAGTKTPFHFGETITTDLANYDGKNIYANEPTGKYREQTTPVGQFPPNGFGLYDMHGNVWEWCADNWHDNYHGALNDGSAWIKDDNDNRSPLRGSSWYSYPNVCRSAYRNLTVRGRDSLDYNVGFRVVCVAGRTS